ncbi:MAG: endopeptidase La [Firmicutes bacterium]|nr:endopeptidase La [Candidatus Caballimonas caccae]
MEEIIEKQKLFRTMPLVALRGKVLFPKNYCTFDVGRNMSVNAINKASETDSYVFISAQKNPLIDSPKPVDIFTVGVIAKIKQIIKMPNSNVKVSVFAEKRAVISEYLENKDFYLVNVIESEYTDSSNELEKEAHLRLAREAFYKYSLFDKRITKDMILTLTGLKDANDFIDNAMSIAPFKDEDVEKILEETETVDRLTDFTKLFSRELEVSELEKKIGEKVKESIDKSQKEYYLREQLRAIHDELGDTDDSENLKKRIEEKNLPIEIKEKALSEVNRLDKINPSSPDYSIILNYLDWLLELPFSNSTVDNEDITKAKEILDNDHFGLEKVKQRIIEYIAVLTLTKQIKGPVLCFVGPPGVGKTSVATSIARALNRKFIRMSLGGVKDEAEIRGHRKTYVGAMPGRIIYGLKNVGSSNPVFLLDEIDKLSSDIHGDPASALLEVLDPEQNASFRDRFMEIPYDLSKVLFITTANSIETIPYPLLDRMEIIELTGYTDEEKLEIAKRYLVPKQIKQNGLTEKKIELTDDALMEIIESYTLEAGVRNLEREIGSVVRKVATKVCENSKLRKQIIKKENISSYLGVKKHLRDMTLEKDEVGATTGLAWTSVGGTTLTIEVSLMRGKGEILLTGKLGDVMKESARAAISYIRANARSYGIDDEVFEKRDIHIHVPEGATPKDGPSAGITMATAILSAFIDKPVKKSIAMTGEITLRGKVLPIGGLKEKALAAYRRGIYTVIIPKENEKDLNDIPKEIREKMNFIAVSEVTEVFKNAINF